MVPPDPKGEVTAIDVETMEKEGRKEEEKVGQKVEMGGGGEGKGEVKTREGAMNEVQRSQGDKARREEGEEREKKEEDTETQIFGSMARLN